MGLSRVVPGTSIEIHTSKDGRLSIYRKGLMVLTMPKETKGDFLKTLQDEIKENK